MKLTTLIIVALFAIVAISTLADARRHKCRSKHCKSKYRFHSRRHRTRAISVKMGVQVTTNGAAQRDGWPNVVLSAQLNGLNFKFAKAPTTKTGFTDNSATFASLDGDYFLDYRLVQNCEIEGVGTNLRFRSLPYEDSLVYKTDKNFEYAIVGVTEGQDEDRIAQIGRELSRQCKERTQRLKQYLQTIGQVYEQYNQEKSKITNDRSIKNAELPAKISALKAAHAKTLQAAEQKLIAEIPTASYPIKQAAAGAENSAGMHWTALSSLQLNGEKYSVGAAAVAKPAASNDPYAQYTSRPVSRPRGGSGAPPSKRKLRKHH